MKKNFLALGTCAFALVLGLVACDDSTSANGSSGDENPAEVSSSSVIPSSSSSVILSDSEGSSSSVVSSSDVIPGTDPGSSCSVASSSSVTSSSSVESSSSVASSSSEKSSSSIASSSSVKSSSSVASSSSAESSSSSVILSSSSEESSSSVASSSSEESSSSVTSSSSVASSSSSSVIPSEVEGSSSSVASSSSAKSSSSVASSSSVKSSSSVVVVKGSMTDSRDGQVYKTVTIGTQTWMAENLNYAYTGVKYNYNGYTSDSTSWCYENEASNCDKYGRLYTWSAVMDSAAQFSVNAGTQCGYGKTCTPNSPHRGICPEGWHVPTNEEYSTLYTYIGGSSTAGSLLKSTSGWYSGGNGSDKYGVSVLPAGYRNYNGGFYYESDDADLWSASEYSSKGAWYQYFRYNYDDARQRNHDKYNGQSLRCLKD
ncbi:MAG: fibrobacter succinogenes major paralogous domain-containing protein [Fibrobacter sp.]|nr:fibrobacter succinogenes major paralogous domain-containing protein [Fibrobacter sp.]